jgi:membrane protein YdbS with pleckstrin-like domain
LIRQFRFFILYALLIAIVCKSVASMMRIDFSIIFYLTLAQSFAVMAVSFLGITLAKKVSIGLIVLVAFVGVQIMIGRDWGFLNWIYVIAETGPSQAQLGTILYHSLVIGIFGWGLGQVWLRP